MSNKSLCHLLCSETFEVRRRDLKTAFVGVLVVFKHVAVFSVYVFVLTGFALVWCRLVALFSQKRTKHILVAVFGYLQ